jgi:nucleotide-binding universal stress UspA family protein
MKVLWSYVPFHQNKENVQSMHRALTQLAGSAENIQVGFVATPTEQELSLAYNIPPKERFNEYPKSRILEEFDDARIKIKATDVHVVEHDTFSTTKAVDRALELANEHQCDLIGMFTHARKGYSRFVLGSFAETAVHRSHKDLLLLNPKAAVRTRIRNVLFASDFGVSSKREISKMFAYAKNLGAHLTIFHQAEIIYKWSLDEKSSEVKNYRKSVEQMKRWIEAEGKKVKVSTRVVISSDYDSVSSHVFRLAKEKKTDLIAVSAKSGPLTTLMGGSVVRKIVRESALPVLVIKSGTKT